MPTQSIGSWWPGQPKAFVFDDLHATPKHRYLTSCMATQSICTDSLANPRRLYLLSWPTQNVGIWWPGQPKCRYLMKVSVFDNLASPKHPYLMVCMPTQSIGIWQPGQPQVSVVDDLANPKHLYLMSWYSSWWPCNWKLWHLTTWPIWSIATVYDNLTTQALLFDDNHANPKHQ